MKALFIECNAEEIKANRRLMDMFYDIGYGIAGLGNLRADGDNEDREADEEDEE